MSTANNTQPVNSALDATKHFLMALFMAFVFLVMAMLDGGCRPTDGSLATPEVPVPNVIVPALPDDYTACAHLGVLGCPEALPPWDSCVGTMVQARTDGLIIPTTCVIAAKTQAEVRVCGDPTRTMTFECVPRMP